MYGVRSTSLRMPSPDDRPSVFSPLQAPPVAPAWEREEEKAHEALHHMENILVKELPRVADMVGGLMRGLEQRLDEAQHEIARLRQTQADLERRHADDAGRLAELDALRRQNAEFAAKLEAVEDLKRALSRL